MGNIFVCNVCLRLKISVINVLIDVANLSLRLNWMILICSLDVLLVSFVKRRSNLCPAFTNIMKYAHLPLSPSSIESAFNHNTNVKNLISSNFLLETSNKWLLLYVLNANNKNYAVQYAVNVMKCIVYSVECLLAPNNAALLVIVLNLLKI